MDFIKKVEVFVISLDSANERRRIVSELFMKYNIEFEFFSAIDGRSLSLDDKLKFVTKESSLSPPEVGCAASHITLLKNFLNGASDFMIVLEDDISFDHKFVKFYNNIKGAGRLPSNILLLGHHSYHSRNIDTACSLKNTILWMGSFRVGRFLELACGTYGYVVDKKGAARILESCPITLPIDHYTGNYLMSEVRGVVNPIVYIDDDLSDNYSEMVQRNEMNLNLRNSNENQSILKKILRIIGLFNFARSIKLKFRKKFLIWRDFIWKS